jgi:FtsZ-binding cell division protein ZapB
MSKQIENILCHIDYLIDEKVKDKSGIIGREPDIQVLRLCTAFNELQAELNDIRLELSCPETSDMDDSPLHEWAAVITCENYRLQAELDKLKADKQMLAKEAVSQVTVNNKLRAELDMAKAEHERLREALEANVRRCDYFNGERLCDEIGIHMTDDCESFTEFRCDKHKGRDILNEYDSGEFKPSRLAIKALQKECE